jgi:hypothetical protein
VVGFAKNSDGLCISLGILQFDPDNVLALLELKDGHAARNVPNEDLINVNARGAGVKSFRSGDVDFEVPRFVFEIAGPKSAQLDNINSPAKTAMNGVFIDSLHR